METSDINRNDDSVKIIAEAGINHNGDLDLAMRLVDAAKAAGADVVKFQTGNASASITKYANTADYQKDSTGSDQQLAMIEQLELPFAAYIDIKDYCDEVGIEFATTFFDKDAACFSLQNLDLRFCKVASGEITNRPLLEIIGSSHLPVILSTGMCMLEEVEDAIAVLRENGCGEITILHCTTEYPAPKDQINLRAMPAMGEHFGLSFGYSDHTEGIEVPVAAVAMGARVIEKHLTLDKTMDGPDHKASLEPDEFALMVEKIRNIERALGCAEKTPGDAEQKNRAIARKSIVAKRDIKAGDLLSEDNITVKRPGTGISAMRWHEVLGTRAIKDFEQDEMIIL